MPGNKYVQKFENIHFPSGLLRLQTLTEVFTNSLHSTILETA